MKAHELNQPNKCNISFIKHITIVDSYLFLFLSNYTIFAADGIVYDCVFVYTDS